MERENFSKKETRDEKFLQKLIFENPRLLPIEEIRPEFLELCPLCRELETGVGPIDAVFVNERGMLTLVECKLWKNPEARRKVVGQILDYAQAMSRWTFKDFDNEVFKSGKSGKTTIERVKDYFSIDDFDEVSFIDSISRNLRNGNFLLLIVGDGIKEGIEEIGDFLKNKASLSFSLAFVEQVFYKFPGGNHDEWLVSPRVLCKTKELVRAVIRDSTESGRITIDSVNYSKDNSLPEFDFYENLKRVTTPQICDEIKDLFAKLSDMGLDVFPGKRGSKVKTIEDIFVTNKEGNPTLFSFIEVLNDGKVDFKGFTGERGVVYKKKVALLNNNWKFLDRENDFSKTVRRITGETISIAEFLEVKEYWLKEVDQTLKDWLKQIAKEDYSL